MSNTQHVQFRAYKGFELLGGCLVEVSDYYAEHGYPEYSSAKNQSEDYYIKEEIRKSYPDATSWSLNK